MQTRWLQSLSMDISRLSVMSEIEMSSVSPTVTSKENDSTDCWKEISKAISGGQKWVKYFRFNKRKNEMFAMWHDRKSIMRIKLILSYLFMLFFLSKHGTKKYRSSQEPYFLFYAKYEFEWLWTSVWWKTFFILRACTLWLLPACHFSWWCFRSIDYKFDKMIIKYWNR